MFGTMMPTMCRGASGARSSADAQGPEPTEADPVSNVPIDVVDGGPRRWPADEARTTRLGRLRILAVAAVSRVWRDVRDGRNRRRSGYTWPASPLTTAYLDATAVSAVSLILLRGSRDSWPRCRTTLKIN